MKAILTYHSIDESGSVISIPEATFRRHVAWLAAGRVRAHFQAAPFDQLMDWLQPLGRDHGVRVEELSLQRAAGVGLVDARLTLVQPGAN